MLFQKEVKHQGPTVRNKRHTSGSFEVSSQKSQAQFATLGGTLCTLKWPTCDDVILGDCCGYTQLEA